ncbi:hypothetical protein D9C73_019371 [Collichthys lucidus]|uniref:Uncharacterized protein n=1 Tax=Collichthys lucidus TaxID=240159 RepID=A0A4U5VE74_COLLU|nr:hypothetical protein D9C73_019371 [Collichthys lucidus]
MFYGIFVKAPLVPECYASREKLSRGVKGGRGGIERAQGRETKDVERNGEQAMGRKRENTGKEIDELGGGRKGEQRKRGIKDTQGVVMLIHSDPWSQCHSQCAWDSGGFMWRRQRGSTMQEEVKAAAITATNRRLKMRNYKDVCE